MKRLAKKLTLHLTFASFAVLSANGCRTASGDNMNDPVAVYVPFIKNSPNECYYVDEFMPVPDGLVTGKTGALSLRYYSYKVANYKEWQKKHIILSFYSTDDRCWSLFEEYNVQE
jgi:hypothetical protein